MTPLRADDAIRSHVAEASRRFRIPAAWIWAVMQAESAGDVRARSKKGAMGLMQIMPATWFLLRARQGLGDDPFDPRDNILAGAAYLRDLHDRYGTRGFLAAYNAGPGRYEDHLTGRRSLPAETMDYVSNVGRRIDLDVSLDAAPSADERIAALRSTLFPTSMFASLAVQPMDKKRSTARSPVDQSADEKRSIARSPADQLTDEKRSIARAPAVQSAGEKRSTVRSPAVQSAGEKRSTVRSPADQSADEKRSIARAPVVQSVDEKRSTARSPADQLRDEKRSTARSPADQPMDEKRSTAWSPADQLTDEERFTTRSPADQSRDEARSIRGTSTDPAAR